MTNNNQFSYYDGIEDDLDKVKDFDGKIKYLNSKKWYNVDTDNPLRDLWIKDVLQDYHELTTK